MFLLINEHSSSIVLQLELKRVKPHKSLMRFLQEFPLEFWKKVHIVSLFWIVFFPSTLGWMAVIQLCLMAKNKNCYALFIWWSRIMEGKDGQKVMPTLSKKWHLGMPYCWNKNNLHFKEDTMNFSGQDNYSCWSKERAGRWYVHTLTITKTLNVLLLPQRSGVRH